MHHRNFTTALEAIHRYFDYRTSSGVSNSHNANTELSSDVSKNFRPQYSALSIAGLHYHFGHLKEAVTSLQEAIYTAQETEDHVCVHLTLKFLLHLFLVEDFVTNEF